MASATEQGGGQGLTTRGMMNVLLLGCRSWATSLEVIVHRAPGERYLGLQAAGVLLLVPFYGLFWSGYDLSLLMAFLPVYLVMCIVARVQIFRRRHRGERCHSYYSGWPRFLGPKAKISEVRMKRFDEPVMTFAAGWLIRQVDAPLGTYLMIGSVCMFINVNMSLALQQFQTLNMTDAVIEQEQIASRFREMRG